MLQNIQDEGTKIICRHSIVNNYLHLQVIDEGIGIPEVGPATFIWKIFQSIKFGKYSGYWAGFEYRKTICRIDERYGEL